MHTLYIINQLINGWYCKQFFETYIWFLCVFINSELTFLHGWSLLLSVLDWNCVGNKVYVNCNSCIVQCIVRNILWGYTEGES